MTKQSLVLWLIAKNAEWEKRPQGTLLEYLINEAYREHQQDKWKARRK